MAIVKLIDGRVIENVSLSDIKHEGEGSRSATAHIEGKTYEVYNSIVDGPNPVWHEQMSYETWKLTQGAAGFVEGSTAQTVDEYEHRKRGKEYQNEKEHREAIRDTQGGVTED